MRTNLIWIGVLLIAIGATAQTTTTVSNHNDGVSGAVPVYSGASTLNSGSSSAIYQSGGNVGIGTTNPQNMLDVAGSLSTTPSGGVWLNEGRTAGIADESSNGSIYFRSGNLDNRMILTSTGSLGLGTTTPNNALDINGAIGFANQNSHDKKLLSPTDGLLVWLTQQAASAHAFEIQEPVTPGTTSPTVTNVHLDGNGNSYLNALSGNVGIGTTSPQAKLEINGGLRFSGDAANLVQTTAWTGVLCGGDYAESVDVMGARAEYEPGDVLLIDPDDPSRFVKASEPYSSGVAGVYSTKPGVLGRRQTSPKSPDEIPMAVVGIVPVKVSAENGPIRPRDLLVSASAPGYAMKGTDRTRMLGSVIGKAMGSLDSGTGVIEVLVTLQ